jgi:hypothetical protein
MWQRLIFGLICGEATGCDSLARAAHDEIGRSEAGGREMDMCQPFWCVLASLPTLSSRTRPVKGQRLHTTRSAQLKSGMAREPALVGRKVDDRVDFWGAIDQKSGLIDAKIRSRTDGPQSLHGAG